MTHRRWLFADQLGPHFLDDPHQPVLLVESRRVFARRRFHRAKAHLVLSALRHRAAELGDQAVFVRSATYGEAVDRVRGQRGPAGQLSVCNPTSYAARRLVDRLDGVEVLPSRGFATSEAEFAAWADRQSGRRLRMEDFYRDARTRLGVLMDGAEPAGGRWNLDADNREPPPRGATRLDLPEPWWPEEDDIDAEVRRDLDRWERDGDVSFLGSDGPRRFAVTRTEARYALRSFVAHRLAAFGPHEDAMLHGDSWMAHSLLSVPLNLGLLDPVEVVEAADSAYRRGDVPLASAEGFVRQVIGWRDYMWHVYWHLGEGHRSLNHLNARRHLPDWWLDLQPEDVTARCLSHVLGEVREHGWAHHIERLMVLGNYALQRGWRPDELTDWFHRAFVDGYDWVMVPNVVGMSQYADGGQMTTKPYAAGGAYLNRMSDHCGRCAYSPTVRVGERACPFTAGYWWFLQRHRERLADNHRMAQPVRGLDRLRDLDELVEQEDRRGSDPP